LNACVCRRTPSSQDHPERIRRAGLSQRQITARQSWRQALTTRDFGTGTRGFAASEDPSVAVCVLPGTELAFAHEIERLPASLWPWRHSAIGHKAAIFRQINKGRIAAHHDALEFPDGDIVLLTL
jgi:hypothetical protein